MGNIFGGGQSSSSTERSSQTYAPWIGEAQQDVSGSAYNMAQGLLQASPFARAAMNADQRKAYDLARLSARNAFEGNEKIPMVDTSGMKVTAAQLDPNEVSGLMNPYLKNVLGTTMDNARREYQNSDAALASKYANSSAFGGSGEAIARGQLARGYAGDSQNMAAKLMADGYNQAQQAALANAQMRQQANLTNMDYGLKAPQVNSQLLDAAQRRELMAAQGILSGGNQQQAFAQSVLDAPWTALQRWQATVPQVYDNNRVTTKETETSGGGNLLGGLGSFMSGLGSLFSDETAKTDIEKVGKDPDTGLMNYAYRYKGDPKTYPKVVGPMAQDVQKKYPEAVRDMGGKLTIDMGLLHSMAKKKA